MSENKEQQNLPATSEQVNRIVAQGNFLGIKSKDIQSYLGRYADQMAAVLPKHITAERMVAMAANEIARNPAIAKCSTRSLVGAILQASILGFQPVNALGYCYFVPYGGDVQFQVGYKGYLDLARRSGAIKNVYAEVVHEGDEFLYTLGLSRTLEHKPSGKIDTPITHAYAVVEFTNGGMNFVVLTREEIERLRRRSPSQKNGVSGAWATDYEAMAKAKALKQLSKYMPLTVDAVNDGAVIKAEAIGDDGTIDTEDISWQEVDENGEVVPDEGQQAAQQNVEAAAELAKKVAKGQSKMEMQ